MCEYKTLFRPLNPNSCYDVLAIRVQVIDFGVPSFLSLFHYGCRARSQKVSSLVEQDFSGVSVPDNLKSVGASLQLRAISDFRSIQDHHFLSDRERSEGKRGNEGRKKPITNSLGHDLMYLLRERYLPCAKLRLSTRFSCVRVFIYWGPMVFHQILKTKSCWTAQVEQFPRSGYGTQLILAGPS